MFGKTRITGHLLPSSVKPAPGEISAKMAADLQPEPLVKPVQVAPAEQDPFEEFEKQAEMLMTKPPEIEPEAVEEPHPAVTAPAPTPAQPVAAFVAKTEEAPAFEPIKETLPFPQVAQEKIRMTGSYISNDLTIIGNLSTQGDITIDGNVQGDIRAAKAIIGDSAVISGELAGDELIIHGKVEGRVRGKKVFLNASAYVTGDIIHGTISVESGAHFEGSVMRKENPLA